MNDLVECPKFQTFYLDNRTLRVLLQGRSRVFASGLSCVRQGTREITFRSAQSERQTVLSRQELANNEFCETYVGYAESKSSPQGFSIPNARSFTTCTFSHCL